MCGILGGVFKEKIKAAENVEKALACLKHRGPDQQKIFLHENIFLAHARLSIIDLNDRASQPMHFKHLSLVFNGEIYNYKVLKAELESAGCEFHTISDSEIILAIYEKYGMEGLKKLEGMFAFCIWDKKQNKFFLVRDRFGEKPLYYFFNQSNFLFASEIPALEILIGRENLKILHKAIQQYFLYSYIPAPFSPYENIFQLEPGMYLEFSLFSWQLEKKRYYDLHAKVKQKWANDNYREACEELKIRLKHAVYERFNTADVPVATFLSGGIDSSIITLLANQISPHDLPVYSVIYPDDPEFNEAGYAKAIIDLSPKIKPNWIEVRENDLLNFTQGVINKLGEPYADSSLIPTSYLCSQVKQKVILGGDGADELFCGYGAYAALQLNQKIPFVLRYLLKKIPVSKNPANLKNRWMRAANYYLSKIEPENSHAYANWRNYASENLMQSLGFNFSPLEDFKHLHLKNLQDIQLADFAINLPDDLLKKIDYASMFYSLEVRSPYLDSALVEWSLALPDKFKIKGLNRKRILKDVFSDMLPEKILRRGKQGFLLPLRKWFQEESLIKNELKELIQSQNILDKKILNQVILAHQKKLADHTVFLWQTYIYLKWMGKHV